MMNQSAPQYLGACLRQDSSQHMAPTCRGLAPCNHTMEGQLTSRIGVFRHRSAALFKYANRKQGIIRLPDVSRTSELETGTRSAYEVSRERNTRFSVPSKERRVVRQPGIHIFKYPHTHFSASKSEITNLSI
jgi:hypothetical protein